MTPGQFGPISRDARARASSARLTCTMSSTGMPSVMQTMSAMPGVGRLEDRVGRERRRHEDHASRSRPSASTASATVSKTGTLPSNVVPPLPGVTPPTTFVPYSQHLLGVERARRPVMPWHDQPRVLVDEDAHVGSCYLRRGDDLLRAASAMSLGGDDVQARLRRGSSCRPRRWCPSRRTTSGTFEPDLLDRGDDARRRSRRTS